MTVKILRFLFLQIRPHCEAFRRGLADVVNIEWLRMFDHNELQILISGASVPIDIDDLRLHTNYSGMLAAPYMTRTDSDFIIVTNIRVCYDRM